MDPNDVPTPRQSGSWHIFAALCRSLIDRAEPAAAALRADAVSKRSANILRRDLSAAIRQESLAASLERIAFDLEGLEPRFQAWEKRPNLANLERAELTPKLTALQREAEEILTSITIPHPKGGRW